MVVIRRLLVIFLAFTALGISAQEYNWEVYGPPGLIAEKVKVVSGEYDKTEYYVHDCIIADDALYVNSWFKSRDWEIFPIAVNDVEGLNENEMLFTIGAGSYSDGIYKLNLNSGEYEVVHYEYFPYFIAKEFYENKYYVGFQGGMLKSSDGETWENITAFVGKNCVSIALWAFGFDNVIVATDEPNNNTYYKEDGSDEWVQIASDYSISQLSAGNRFGGIATLPSGEVGFYLLKNGGWELQMESENLYTIGNDNMGWTFLGWYDGIAPYKGVARYKQYELTFLNDGLPNLNIKNFTTWEDAVGGGIIIVCTEGGNYICNDYTLDISDQLSDKPDISIYPNPCTTRELTISKSDGYQIDRINITNQNGKLLQCVDHIPNSGDIIVNLVDVAPGLYFVIISSDRELYMKKLLIY